MLKMNTLLAKVDHGQKSFNKMIADYVAFFSKNQGMFVGVHKTYEPRDGYLPDDSKRGHIFVVTTVDEKLQWFEGNAKEYLTGLFSIEATNSAGAHRVPLIVEGVMLGNLTALELMRLKSILTDANYSKMYENIPVRSDSKNWEETDNEDYVNRAIYETSVLSGISRTTEKEEVILFDPNIANMKTMPSYAPKTVVKSKTVEIGDYTVQEFSGEWSQRKKAELLRRKGKVLEAVIAALKEVNDIEIVDANLQVSGLIDYLHYGELKK